MVDVRNASYLTRNALMPKSMSINDIAEAKSNRKAILVFAERVRVERARRQWSQAEVAQRAGTTPDRVSQIETGNTDPRLSTIERIADVLGIQFCVGSAA